MPKYLSGKLGDNCKRFLAKNTKRYQDQTIAIYNNKAQEAHLLSTCFATLCHKLLGTITKAQCYKDFILSCQQENGYFVDPQFKEQDLLAKHNKDYLYLQFTYFSLLALSALDTQPRHKLHFLQSFYSCEYMESWLNKLDWSFPWRESNNVMFVICLLSHRYTQEMSVELQDTFFKVLNAQQNPQTGLWGKEDSILEGIAGAYHFLLPYYYHNREIKYQERIIDSALSLISFDHLFVEDGGGGACEDLDAIDILCKLTQRTSYKKQEIHDALNKTLQCLVCCQNYDGGFSYRFNPFSFNLISMPKFSTTQWNLYISNVLNYPRKRWHYYSTWYFSSWQKMPFPLHKSDMWSTYARLSSIAAICEVLNIEKGNFIDDIGIGWH